MSELASLQFLKLDKGRFGKSNSIKRNIHWKLCEDKNIPFIVAVKRGTRFYDVHYDMFSTRYSVNDQGKLLIKKLIRDELDLIEANKEIKTFTATSWAGQTSGGLDKVHQSRIIPFLEKMYYICTIYTEALP